MARRRPRQQVFLWKTRGGARKGAGRKPAPANVGLQPHGARPAFSQHVPVHVTMRAMRGVPKMRSQAVFNVVYGELSRASEKGFRLVDFSIQDDHVHLIVEADDAKMLSRGMQRLASRIAMAVNALVGRRGRFWRERYHRRDLATPRQVRNAMVYVLFNFRKHSPASDRTRRASAIDGCSSGLWVDAWTSKSLVERLRERRARAGPRPTALPKTWLARVGWKRHGLLDPREAPKFPS